MLNKIKRPSGFTLIELLIVIAIIGILSGMGLVTFTGAQKNARDAKRKSDISSLQSAFALYADDNKGEYPVGLNPSSHAPDIVEPLIYNASGTPTVVPGGAWDAMISAPSPGPYLKSLPNPPSTPGYNMYFYGRDAPKHYMVYAQMERTNFWYYVNDFGVATQTLTDENPECGATCP